MEKDDVAEKLALDIEARKERDQAELAAWRNAQMNEINKAQAETAERLGTENSGVWRDYRQKRDEIQNEYEKRRNSNEAAQAKLDNELADGKLHHVWIDARDEEKFDAAKKVWDFMVKDRSESHGKTINEKDIEEFEKQYGLQIVNQLKQSTAREFQQQKEAEQTMQSEKKERARLHEAEQNAQVERDRIEEKQHDLRKNGMNMTFDTDPTPERLKNPLDKVAAEYIRLAAESKRQREKEEQAQKPKPLSLSEQLLLKYKSNQQEMNEGMTP